MQTDTETVDYFKETLQHIHYDSIHSWLIVRHSFICTYTPTQTPMLWRNLSNYAARSQTLHKAFKQFHMNICRPDSEADWDESHSRFSRSPVSLQRLPFVRASNRKRKQLLGVCVSRSATCNCCWKQKMKISPRCGNSTVYCIWRRDVFSTILSTFILSGKSYTFKRCVKAHTVDSAKSWLWQTTRVHASASLQPHHRWYLDAC